VVNSFRHTDIFNDLNVHWFPQALLQNAPRELWTNAKEPVYSDEDDVEIVLSDI
jgi:hypothetical protein